MGESCRRTFSWKILYFVDFGLPILFSHPMVFSVVLAISMSIGIFYGCVGSSSSKNYLLADRQMSSIPVALSMICSAVSAITLLANPVEIYLYGLQYVMVILSFIPFNLSLAYFYIPVYFNLNVESAYEFIEIRFNYTVRLFVSILAVLHVIISMAIAIYAPSLAIEQVTGISVDITTFVIYFVCIFYSALGGLKAVLWTDVFQALIMLISLAVIAGKGTAEIGLSTIWERAKEHDRTTVLNFDPDPRTRHTIWTCIIAGYFFWLPSYAATQLQVQRFLSMPTMSRVKRALIINACGLVIIVGLCFYTGLVVFAQFHNCDPIQTKEISKSDQLLPLFVSKTSGSGFLGLFIAGLTCASMSSLSSGLTALASITAYDYVRKLFPNLSDTNLSRISKFNTFALGMVSYAFVYAIKNMGSILPATSSFLGVMLGPTLGIFTAGMLPYANSKGSLFGTIITFIIMTSFVILNNLKSDELPNQSLPLSTSGCLASNSTTEVPSFYVDWKEKHSEDSLLIKMLSLSYMWYSSLGCVLSVLLGQIFSLIVNATGKEERKLIDRRCISPPILYLFVKYCPDHIKKWVDLDTKDIDLKSIGNNNETIKVTAAKKQAN